jgi:hypothetical protein
MAAERLRPERRPNLSTLPLGAVLRGCGLGHDNEA